MPVANESKTNSIGGIASQFGINVSSDNNSLASVRLIPDLIFSRSLLTSLLMRKVSSPSEKNKITLLEHYFGKSIKNNIYKASHLNDGIVMLKNSISVNTRRYNDIIDITVSASNAVTAVDIGLAVVEELDKIQKQISSSRAKEKLLYISNRLLKVESELKTSEENLKEFREKNRNIGGSPSLMLAENRIKREVSSISSIYNTLKSQYEITRIEETGSSKLIQIIDKPTKPLYRSSPQRTKSVIFSFFISLGLSIMFSYFKEVYPSIKSELT